MTFTKAELTSALIAKLKMPKVDAQSFVTNFFEEIGRTLEAGHHLKLSGMGKFVLRDKKSRPGRNPRTKESIPVSERRVVTFQASQTLKSRMMFIYESAQNKKSLFQELLPKGSESKKGKRSIKALETISTS